MILMIVESATKSKKIQGFLGSDYKVVACFGHIFDLPPKSLGIDTTTWTPTYVPSKPKIIDEITKLSKKAKYALLACDPDREGHGIAHHLTKVVKCPYYRVVFHEINKQAILEAINNKHDIDTNIVYAQETRRLLDRLCGYKLSPLLWKQFNINTLSSGRVQSCVLALVMKRKHDIASQSMIDSFVNNIEHNLNGDFEHGLNGAQYVTTDKSIDKFRSLLSRTTTTTPPFDFKGPWSVSYTMKPTTKNPPPPFITTTVQIACLNQLGIKTKTCMNILQTLYEDGLITYHRTDSVAMSKQFIQKAGVYIKNKYGEKYFKYRPYDKQADSGAHECIRVVDIALSESKHKFNAVYKLIWRRTIQALMASAEYNQYNISITSNSVHVFKTTKLQLTFPGFLVVGSNSSETETNTKEINIPSTTSLVRLYTTANTPNKLTLYSEATLIKEMEDCGIGRPSTYASIISHIITKSYVEYTCNPTKTITCDTYSCHRDNPKQLVTEKTDIELYAKGSKNMLRSTEIGDDIVRYLNNVSTYILQSDITKIMEDNLDKIANSQANYKDILNAFHTQINRSIEIANTSRRTNTDNKLFTYTKYGRCVIHQEKYINIEGFLKQLQLSEENFVQKHRDFVIKLPMDFDDKYMLCIGRYGLYYKQKSDNKNVKFTGKDLKNIIEKNDL